MRPGSMLLSPRLLAMAAWSHGPTSGSPIPASGDWWLENTTTTRSVPPTFPRLPMAYRSSGTTSSLGRPRRCSGASPSPFLRRPTPAKGSSTEHRDSSLRTAAEAPEYLGHCDDGERARDEQGVDKRELGQPQQGVDQECQHEEVAAAHAVKENQRA